MPNNKYVGCFDFASLYPTIMRDIGTLDPYQIKEMKRKQQIKERREKLEQLKKVFEDEF